MIRALNLPSHGRDVYAGVFPRVCCGNKAFLSLSNIIGARCRRFILWLRGRLMESRLRTKFHDDKGYYGFKRFTRFLFLWEERCLRSRAAAQWAAAQREGRAATFDLHEKTPRPLTLLSFQEKQKKGKHLIQMALLLKTCMVKISGWLNFFHYKKLQPLQYITIVSLNICSFFLCHRTRVFKILIMKNLYYLSQRVSKPRIYSYSSIGAILVIRLSLLQRLIHWETSSWDAMPEVALKA